MHRTANLPSEEVRISIAAPPPPRRPGRRPLVAGFNSGWAGNVDFLGFFSFGSEHGVRDLGGVHGRRRAIENDAGG